MVRWQTQDMPPLGQAHENYPLEKKNHLQNNSQCCHILAGLKDISTQWFQPKDPTGPNDNLHHSNIYCIVATSQLDSTGTQYFNQNPNKLIAQLILGGDMSLCGNQGTRLSSVAAKNSV